MWLPCACSGACHRSIIKGFSRATVISEVEGKIHQVPIGMVPCFTANENLHNVRFII